MSTMETQWHLSRQFIITLAIGLVCNIAGFVWAASSAYSKLEEHEVHIIECKESKNVIYETLKEIQIDVAVIKEKVKNL